MEQLSPSDSFFFTIEVPNAPGHVGGLTILDISDAPDFSFERLRQVVDERIRLSSRFTSKVREAPLGLDRPYLVEDADFDVAKHLHRVAVPAPGGMRELTELAAYLFSHPLDRGKPLWEMWFIEGVENGRVAMLMKSHHCLMDGSAAAGLGEIMCDLEPRPSDGPLVVPPNSDEGEISDLQIAMRAVANVAKTPVKMGAFAGTMLRQGAAMLRASFLDPQAPPLPTEVPTVSFNDVIGPRRGFACSSVSLDDVKTVKDHFGVTVNDVALALTSGAIRKYLERRWELPEQSLVALIAISARAEGDTSAGNQITSVPVRWCTDIKDPVDRLLQIHENALAAKEFAQNYDAKILALMGDVLPPSVMNRIMRAATSRMPAMNPANAVVSNVRGTPVPLYTAGARIESIYPMSLLGSGQGLNVTIVTYMGRMDIGLTVDPDLVTDPWSIAEAIPAALEELKACVSTQGSEVKAA